MQNLWKTSSFLMCNIFASTVFYGILFHNTPTSDFFAVFSIREIA